MKRSTILLSVGMLLLCLTAHAGVPHLIGFQGILKDVNGQPVADGTYPVIFEIYDAVGPGGGCLWLENQMVTTQGGLFSVVLGSNSQGIPDSAFADTGRWLAITVGNDPEIVPRQRLVSVGYSFRVNSVDGATGGSILGDVSIQSGLPVSGNSNALGNARAGTAELHLGVANDTPKLEFKEAEPRMMSFELTFDPFEDGVKSKTSVANGSLSAAAYRWMTQLLPQPETEVMRIDYGGDVSIQSNLSVDGGVNAQTMVLGSINPGPPSVTPLSLQAAPGQSANLMEIKDDQGRVRIAVTKDGKMETYDYPGGYAGRFEGIDGGSNNVEFSLDSLGGIHAAGASSFSDKVSIGTAASGSKLCVGGAIATPVTSTGGAPITLDETHSVLLSPGSQIGCLVYLPTAVGIAGRQYTIKQTQVGQTNVLPFGGQLIDDSPSYVLSAPGKYVCIVCDGANWWVIGSN